MISRIIVTIFAVLFIVFLLSVFGPKKSARKFWLIIFKARRMMDRCCYLFFKLYVAVIVLFIVVMMAHKLI